MLKIIAQNLFGYDMIIIIVAAINAFIIYPKAKTASVHLRDHLQPKVYVPIDLLMERVRGIQGKKIDLNAMKSMRSDEIHFYSMFTSINSAFPMLGMLGTILSLLGLIQESQEQLTLSFTTALTSTLWGLIFALVFKAIDATLAPIVEQNQDNLKLILERMDQVSRIEDAHAEI